RFHGRSFAPRERAAYALPGPPESWTSRLSCARTGVDLAEPNARSSMVRLMCGPASTPAAGLANRVIRGVGPVASTDNTVRDTLLTVISTVYRPIWFLPPHPG